MDKERERLIEEDRKVVQFPPPNYSKMSNDQIRKRTKIMNKTFDSYFGKIKKSEEKR